jgi:hypothetical protein
VRICHDGCCLMLEDTVEVFNLVLGLKLTKDEKPTWWRSFANYDGDHVRSRRGDPVPESKLAREATDLLREHGTALLLAHSPRVLRRTVADSAEVRREIMKIGFIGLGHGGDALDWSALGRLAAEDAGLEDSPSQRRSEQERRNG